MKNATAPVPVVTPPSGTGTSRGGTGKRQQQLYSPGSGPLRKTDATGSNRSLPGSSGSAGPDAPPGRADPPQPGAWTADREVGERPAGGSVNRRLGEMARPEPRPVHQRDTRSVEPRYVNSTKKPPMPSLSHLENLPPRLQKKTLQDLGLPPNYLEIMRAEHQQHQAQTLPNRSSARHNRGRMRYSGGGNGGGGSGGGGGGGGYYPSATYGGGRSGGRPSINDDYHTRPRSRSSDVGSEPDGVATVGGGYGVRRGWDQRRPDTSGPNSRNSSCDRKERSRGGRFDDEPQHGSSSYRSTQLARRESFTGSWADEEPNVPSWAEPEEQRWQSSVPDAELAHPPPPTGKTGGNRNRQRNRRLDRRSKSKRPSNSRSRNDYYDEFKVPYAPQRTGPGSSRSRRNSQSSNVSRENSSERAFSRAGGGGGGGGGGGRRGNYRDTSHDRYGYEPSGPGRFRRHSRDRYITRSRDSSVDRGRDGEGNWRSGGGGGGVEGVTSPSDRAIAEMTKQFESSIGIQKSPGVLVIPGGCGLNSKDSSRRQPSASTASTGNETQQPAKLLYDPKNPAQPIVVQHPQSRVGHRDDGHSRRPQQPQQALVGGPAWYDPDSRQAKLLRHRELVYRVAEAHAQLQELTDGGQLFAEWDRHVSVRQRLQQLLETLLVQEMRFAQDVNVEHHFWKLLFYGVIEQLRKMLADTTDEPGRRYLQERALEVVESGTAYFEQLLALLEREYHFSLERFIGANAATSAKGLRYALALVSAQKIFLFLGDLARYREQITEGGNFRRAKQWYVKAQQILPKNGRPYNQLALLSVYAKRKIDAVYFYMRSLMSSNPFESARESLMDLFNETKKKFESNQRKREEKLRARRKEKEQHRFDGNLRREIWIHPEGGSRVHRTGPLHPIVSGSAGDTSEEEELSRLCSIELNKRFIISFLHVLGKLITKTGMESFAQCAHQMLREFRALMQFSPVAVTSYRLLQLVSLNMFAIEMTKLKETATAPGTRSELQECALSSGLLMFGILLERLIRLIQDTLEVPPGGSSEAISGACSTDDPAATTNTSTTKLVLSEDAKVILPAIKVWCDWMMANSESWNPPPCCADFKIGKSSVHDPWAELATLMTILKSLDTNRGILSVEQKDDYETVRLPEDITLAGFTPLMYYDPEPIFVQRERDMEEAQNVLRIQKLLYFGTDRLCNCDPPVLRRECAPSGTGTSNGTARFFSVVQTRSADGLSDVDILLESFSDDELEIVDGGEVEPDSASTEQKSPPPQQQQQQQQQTSLGGASSSTDSGVLSGSSSNSPSSLETRKLLRRKDELERKQRMQEKHNQRLQDILSQSTIAVSIEVHPRFLVPDTNCFVDYLPAIEVIAKAHPLYQLMVPIIVINELEGLSKGIRHQSPKHQPTTSVSIAEATLRTAGPIDSTVASATPFSNSAVSTASLQHAAKVADASKKALQFIKARNPAVKCVTTKGSILKTSSFTVEDDVGELKSNDDRILETALNLCRNPVQETRAGTRYVTLHVVLLTTDRNLRVKAISNDLPVRELADFIKWAGLSA